MKHCYLSILSFFFQLCVFAQAPALAFRHLTSTHGLSQNHVYCILQDHKGFMWFGTQNALNKYDGYKFTIYKNNPEDINSISGNYIRAVYEDKEKNLWVGTLNGLNLYDRDHDRFIRFTHQPQLKNSISHNEITSIYEDRNGDLWIGTIDGLNLLDKKNKTFSRFPIKRNRVISPSDNFLSSIYEDKKGNFWVGTSAEGLFLFDRKSKTFQKKFEPHPENKASISGVFIVAMVEDRKGNLWIATTAGVNLFDRDTETFKHYVHDSKNKNSLGHNVVYSMYEDSKGNIWIGTMNTGLNHFDPQTGQFTQYQHDPSDEFSISNNTPSAIYEDRSGTLWVGVHRGGVNYYNPLHQKFFTKKLQSNRNSLNNNNVRSMSEDSLGRIWIGTDGGGLNVFDRKANRFSYYMHDPKDPNTISSNIVVSSLVDSRGILWVGTFQGGLNRFDQESNRFTHYYLDPKKPTNIINNIWYTVEDKESNLWLADYDHGFYIFDRKKNGIFPFSYNDNRQIDISAYDVRIAFRDSRKNLWFGTFRGGLIHFDPATKKITSYSHIENNAKNISSNEILSIFEDSKMRFWIGTRSGLNLFDRDKKTFSVYKESDGLPSDVIQSITEDKKGNLWMGTLAGLSRFNTETKQFKNYNELDGLQGNEFSRNACLRASDGELFFGGINGFNHFNPDSIRENHYVPPVYITNFQVFNKAVGIGNGSPLMNNINDAKEIKLSFSQSVFSFEFAALNYITPEKNNYAYMLEGFDESWNYSGNQRTATYTNLDPGEYVFRVKASNNDGIWNENGASVKIIITPPFWMTTWFRVLATLFIISCLVIFYKVRIGMINKQKEILEVQVEKRTRTEEELRNLSAHLQDVREEERIRIAREIHDELGQQMTGIKMDIAWVSKKMQNPEESLKVKLQGVLKLLDESVRSIRRISTELRPSILDDLGLIAAIEWQSREFESRSGIAMNFTFDVPEFSVPPNIATGLFRIYQESLTNVARHAAATEVQSSLHISGKKITLMISDNGKGFIENNISYKKTLGLLGMKERTLMMEGEFRILTALGKGTTILVTVPCKAC